MFNSLPTGHAATVVCGATEHCSLKLDEEQQVDGS